MMSHRSPDTPNVLRQRTVASPSQPHVATGMRVCKQKATPGVKSLSKTERHLVQRGSSVNICTRKRGLSRAPLANPSTLVCVSPNFSAVRGSLPQRWFDVNLGLMQILVGFLGESKTTKSELVSCRTAVGWTPTTNTSCKWLVLGLFPRSAVWIA